ncbi:MAG: hypothetical protein V4726_13590 [Verrucomicrobiota bacterium]
MKRNLISGTGQSCLAIAALALLTATSQAALYGVSFFNNELFTVDPATGAGTVVTTFPENVGAYGLSAVGNSLFTFNANKDVVQEINPFTGAIVRDISIGIGDRIGEGDIAFGSAGTGFIASALNGSDFSLDNGLYAFNILTGTSSRVGTTTLAGNGLAIDGLAFTGGTLYGLSMDAAPSLYTINPATAELTLVSALNFGSYSFAGGSAFSGLTAGAAAGSLYAALDDRLFTINIADGTTTPADLNTMDFGFSGVSGLANSAVPEPGATLLGMLSLGLLARRRRR